jgi:hypothetical protein
VVEARANVGIALSNLMHGLPTPEKIDKANSAMDAWIKELEAANHDGLPVGDSK